MYEPSVKGVRDHGWDRVFNDDHHGREIRHTCTALQHGLQRR